MCVGWGCIVVVVVVAVAVVAVVAVVVVVRGDWQGGVFDDAADDVVKLSSCQVVKLLSCQAVKYC